MNNRNLGLKELAINNENIPNLSAISKLESLMISGSKIISPSGLNISGYSNLRCLKLYSLSIEDVSSLDEIHELHLHFCYKIRDISCLNHNHKIVIDGCNGITDYSNSFRYSNIIHFTYFFTPETIQAFDFSKALEVRTIYFCGGKSQKPLKFPQSSNLYSVRVKDIDGPFQLPPDHNIRELLLYRTMMKSLLKFDDIYSVKLYCLTVSSLTGLGSGNRVVEVNYCPFIKDFSPLRHCDKVTISNCKGFQDVNQVRDVKELIYHQV